MFALGAIDVNGIGSIDSDLKHLIRLVLLGRNVATVESILHRRAGFVGRALHDRMVLYIISLAS